MKRLKLIALMGVLGIAASATGHMQQKNRPIKLPDLFVSSVSAGEGGAGLIKSVRVTVKNTCDVPSKASYVLVKFLDKQGAGAKELYYIGHEVKALQGGESQTQIIEVGNKEIPAGTHLRVEVDPYNKVKEDVEENNFREINPNKAPFPDNGATHCKPKI